MKWYITIHKPKMKALGATFWPIMAIRRLEDKRTECEVYSRVVGYLRPVKQWNRGKQQEFKDRKTFDMTVKKLS